MPPCGPRACEPQGGKLSTNTEARMPQGEPCGVFDMVDQLHVTDFATMDSDFARLQDWQDFWIVNFR